MFVAILKKTPVCTVPIAILVLAWLSINSIATLPPARHELVLLAPYLVTALGLFMAVHFHRGRPFLALLLLASFYWASNNLINLGDDVAADPVYQACVLLVPSNLALFALMRERGVLTLAGRLRLAFLGLQACGAVWLFRHHLSGLQRFLEASYLSYPLPEWLLVPQPALLLGLLCFLVVAVVALRHQTPVDSGLLGGMAAFFVASNWITSPDIHATFCTAGVLIITQSVLRDSYNMAFRDDLTGIPSRRALNEGLQGVGRRYTVAMVDVDHFKGFNDTYGHDVGDQVLKMVAARLNRVGGGGKAYRYGGEEFAILFPGRSCEDALPHLEELRKTIASYRLALRGNDRPKDHRQGKSQRGSRSASDGGAYASVTISIGVAESSEGLRPPEVIKAADKALYKAKSRGRNQVSR